MMIITTYYEVKNMMQKEFFKDRLSQITKDLVDSMKKKSNITFVERATNKELNDSDVETVIQNILADVLETAFGNSIVIYDDDATKKAFKKLQDSCMEIDSKISDVIERLKKDTVFDASYFSNMINAMLEKIKNVVNDRDLEDLMEESYLKQTMTVMAEVFHRFLDCMPDDPDPDVSITMLIHDLEEVKDILSTIMIQ